MVWVVLALCCGDGADGVCGGAAKSIVESQSNTAVAAVDSALATLVRSAAEDRERLANVEALRIGEERADGHDEHIELGQLPPSMIRRLARTNRVSGHRSVPERKKWITDTLNEIVGPMMASDSVFEPSPSPHKLALDVDEHLENGLAGGESIADSGFDWGEFKVAPPTPPKNLALQSLVGTLHFAEDDKPRPFEFFVIGR